MASIWHTVNLTKFLDNTHDLDAIAIDVALATSTFVPNKDDEFIDQADGDDVESGELSVSGYVRGFGGAGRHSAASNDVTNDLTNDRSKLDATDPAVWTALASGETIAWAPVLHEITNDAASILIISLDVDPDVPTNGGNVTLAFHVDGIGYIST